MTDANPAVNTLDSFSELEIARHQEWLRNFARELLSDSATAEDVAQDTWLAFLRRPPSADRPLRPWLSAVLRNLALNLKRGQARRRSREDSIVDSAATTSYPAAEELAHEAESFSVLLQLVLELEEPQREAVLLRYFKNVAPIEIAKQLGIPAGTVRSKLSAARASIRASLESRGGEQDSKAWMTVLLPVANSAAPATQAATWLFSAKAVAAALIGFALLSVAYYIQAPNGQAIASNTSPLLTDSSEGGDREGDIISTVGLISEPVRIDRRTEIPPQVAVAHSPATSIRGRVILPEVNGAPLDFTRATESTVWLYETKDSGDSSAAGGTETLLATTQCDSEGRFEFDIPPSSKMSIAANVHLPAPRERKWFAMDAPHEFGLFRGQAHVPDTGIVELRLRVQTRTAQVRCFVSGSDGALIEELRYGLAWSVNPPARLESKQNGVAGLMRLPEPQELNRKLDYVPGGHATFTLELPVQFDLMINTAVDAPGFMRGGVLIELDRDDDVTTEAAIVLNRSRGGLSGRVIDGNGQPVATAEIAPISTGKAPSGFQNPAESVIQSDQAGRFRHTSLSGAPLTGIIVSAEGFAPRIVDRSECGGVWEGLEIVMQASAQLHGLVLDERGNPIFGAKVVARVGGTSSLLMNAGFWSEAVISDEQGAYVFENVPAQRVSIWTERFAKPEHGGFALNSTARETLEMNSGETTRHDIRLASGRKLTFKLVAPKGGRANGIYEAALYTRSELDREDGAPIAVVVATVEVPLTMAGLPSRLLVLRVRSGLESFVDYEIEGGSKDINLGVIDTESSVRRPH